MTGISKTDEGIALLARMNERVPRYVAKRNEEGVQHASQGEIAGNAPHVVPNQKLCHFAETPMRAGSSADIRDHVVTNVPSAATNVPPSD